MFRFYLLVTLMSLLTDVPSVTLAKMASVGLNGLILLFSRRQLSTSVRLAVKGFTYYASMIKKIMPRTLKKEMHTRA